MTSLPVTNIILFTTQRCVRRVLSVTVYLLAFVCYGYLMTHCSKYADVSCIKCCSEVNTHKHGGGAKL